MNITKEAYIQMTRDTVAPGVEILARLTPQLAHRWHMLNGITGELAELHDAIGNRDVENAVEETHDVLYYVTALADSHGVELSDFAYLRHREVDWTRLSEQVTAVSVFAGDYWDVFKRPVCYGKSKLTPEEQQQTAAEAIRRMYSAILHCGYTLGKIPDELRELNSMKLTRGQNARYKTGKFDADAAVRRDDKTA